MTRTLHTHEVTPLNKQISIVTGARIGAGGAPLEYLVSLPQPTARRNADGSMTTMGKPSVLYIEFQEGMPDVVGVNGFTIEALLAIALDRLEHFQSGAWPCSENAIAVDAINDALAILRCRTERLEREAANPPDRDAEGFTAEQRATIEKGMEQSRNGEVVTVDLSAHADDVVEDDETDELPPVDIPEAKAEAADIALEEKRRLAVPQVFTQELNGEFIDPAKPGTDETAEIDDFAEDDTAEEDAIDDFGTDAVATPVDTKAPTEVIKKSATKPKKSGKK